MALAVPAIVRGALTAAQDQPDPELDGLEELAEELDPAVATEAPMAILQPEGETEMRLSLSNCLAMALQENFDVILARDDIRLASTSRTAAEAQFDFMLSAETQYTRSRDGEVTREFDGKRSDTDTWVLSSTLSRYFSTGTTASLTASYNLNHREAEAITNPFTGGTAAAAYVSQTETPSLSLQITQNLFKDMGEGPNLYSLRVAELSEQIKESGYTQQSLETLFAVEQAFWDLVYAREDLAVTRSALELALNEQRIMEQRQAVGVATSLNTATVRVQVANKLRELIDKVKTVRDASDALLVLIAPERLRDLLNRSAPVLIVPPEDALSTVQMPATMPDPYEEINTALANRAEVEQAKLNIQVASEGVAYRDNQTGVDLEASTGVTLSGQGDHTGPAFESFGKAQNLDWFIGLELSYPLGNTEAESNRREAEIELDQARVQLRQAEVSVIAEVLGAIRGIEAAQQQLQASAAARDLAERQLRAEERRSARGLSTQFNVQQYQNDFEEAKRQVLQARIGLHIAWLTLRKATGTLGSDLALPEPDAEAPVPPGDEENGDAEAEESD